MSFGRPRPLRSSAKSESPRPCSNLKTASKFPPLTRTIPRIRSDSKIHWGRFPHLSWRAARRSSISAVIVEYLDWLAGGGKIIPSDPKARFRSLTQESLADGIADAAVLMRYETVWRESEFQSEKWLAYQGDKIARALRAFEQAPPEKISDVGTIALACALGYLDLRFEGAWRMKHPGLVAWLDVFSEATPSFEATRFRG